MPNVQVVLRSDVPGVGHKGDVVEVSKGYSRNYLAPRGLAFPATAGAIEQSESMRRSRMLKDTKDREEATELATELVSKVISIGAKSGESGKLFGSVTTADISAAILEQTGAVIDRRNIASEEHIKDLGSHQVQVSLHTEVQFPMTIEVIAE